MGGSQEETRTGSESSSTGEAKSDVEKSPEELAGDQSRVPETKAETRTKARTSPISQTSPLSFFILRIEEGFEDYYAQDGSSTSLVSSRSHT
jgi:hypothetical protein